MENEDIDKEDPMTSRFEDYWKDFQYLNGVVGDNMVSAEIPKFEKKESVTKQLPREVLEGVKKLFNNGSLHGVKFIVDTSYPLKDRLTWVGILLISLAFCGAHITRLLSKWTSSSFVNVVDSLPTPVWAVPFPSVLICPQLHAKLSYVNVSEVDGMDNFFASLVCPYMSNLKLSLDRRLTPEEMDSLREFVLQASLSCEDVIKRCDWKSLTDDDERQWNSADCCRKYFNPVFTNYGLCYGFNTLPLNGMTNVTRAWHQSIGHGNLAGLPVWSLDKGYADDLSFDKNSLPYRAIASGEQHGLTLELFLNTSERQFDCDGSNSGFNLIIGSPTDHVYISTVIRVPMERMTTIEVTAATHQTEAALRPVDPEKRKCFFQDEIQLEYYAMYTDSNCKQDLLISAARDMCGCVPIYWPQKNLHDSICTTRDDFNCVKRVEREVQEAMIALFYEATPDSSATCYPSCNDVLYYSRLFYSDFKSDIAEQYPPWSDGPLKEGEVTRINVHFYDDMFLGLHRHVQYDDYYLVGAVGGLLSLFLGFSVISVAELVYFVMLKPLERVLQQLRS